LGHVLDGFRIAAAARSNGPPEPLFFAEAGGASRRQTLPVDVLQSFLIGVPDPCHVSGNGSGEGYVR
jgi:hypothetical protein